ncbi:AMP-binding protein [Nocardia otitidiscaviarum]|uniref:AMP-binding protein n=1 Tax=Nocardia otitidiscaviarum TaxID=1823 RepID=A0A516NKW6_9NOCA|nr:AMP-binding protein [Nocardia otitidiscaviarum]MCP9618836.1 AMP-binding protein [Nocardia otitidiscaviarum]QDP79519.1 AMP-binding protein [Nocardia otitidiscaviarum]
MTTSHAGSRPATVVDAIVRNAGDATLTVLDGDNPGAAVSWAAVHRRALRLATVLRAHGIGPNRRVGLLGDTSVELVAALQAVWLGGAAATMLPAVLPGSPGVHARTVAAMVGDARLDLVIVDTRIASVTRLVPARVLPLADLVTAAATAEPITPPRPAPESLALLQYTSGSTRAPRGVAVSHAHLSANIAAIAAAVGYDGGYPERVLSWLPLYHDLGLICFLAVPMSYGGELVLQSPLAFARRPESWAEAIARYRITASGAPNFAYELTARVLAGDSRLDLSSLRLLISGGEPVNPDTMARFTAAATRCGLRPSVVVPAYGLAEATVAVTISPPGTGIGVDEVDAYVLESAGRAIPAAPGVPVRRLVKLGPAVRDTSIRIVGALSGTPVAARVVGHIEIRGPSVVRAGWLRTGDIGYLTDDRQLVVCGRAKDMLILCGRNIFPQDIEAVAAQIPGMRPGRVAAFGIPGAFGDDLVVAVEANGDDTDELRRAVAAAVFDAVGSRPYAVIVVPRGGLPRTSSGKVRRAEARRRFAAEAPHSRERTVQ